MFKSAHSYTDTYKYAHTSSHADSRDSFFFFRYVSLSPIALAGLQRPSLLISPPLSLSHSMCVCVCVCVIIFVDILYNLFFLFVCHFSFFPCLYFIILLLRTVEYSILSSFYQSYFSP